MWDVLWKCCTALFRNHQSLWRAVKPHAQSVKKYGCYDPYSGLQVLQLSMAQDQSLLMLVNLVHRAAAPVIIITVPYMHNICFVVTNHDKPICHPFYISVRHSLIRKLCEWIKIYSCVTYFWVWLTVADISIAHIPFSEQFHSILHFYLSTCNVSTLLNACISEVPKCSTPYKSDG